MPWYSVSHALALPSWTLMQQAQLKAFLHFKFPGLWCFITAVEMNRVKSTGDSSLESALDGSRHDRHTCYAGGSTWSHWLHWMALNMAGRVNWLHWMALDVVTLVTLDGSRHGRWTGYTGWLSTWQVHWFPCVTSHGAFGELPRGFALSPLTAASRTSIGLLLCTYYVGRFSLVSAALSQEAPFCLLLATIELSHVFPTISLTTRLQYLGLVASLFYELGNTHDIPQGKYLLNVLPFQCLPWNPRYLCELPVFPPVA